MTNKQRKSKLSPEKYQQLRAEAKAPYRGLRKIIYFTFAASGFIGAVIFLAQLAAGTSVSSTLPNLGLQIGIITLMIFLYRWENKAEEKANQKSK